MRNSRFTDKFFYWKCLCGQLRKSHTRLTQIPVQGWRTRALHRPTWIVSSTDNQILTNFPTLTQPKCSHEAREQMFTYLETSVFALPTAGFISYPLSMAASSWKVSWLGLWGLELSQTLCLGQGNDVMHLCAPCAVSLVHAPCVWNGSILEHSGHRGWCAGPCMLQHFCSRAWPPADPHGWCSTTLHGHATSGEVFEQQWEFELGKHKTAKEWMHSTRWVSADKPLPSWQAILGLECRPGKQNSLQTRSLAHPGREIENVYQWSAHMPDFSPCGGRAGSCNRIQDRR